MAGEMTHQGPNRPTIGGWRDSRAGPGVAAAGGEAGRIERRKVRPDVVVGVLEGGPGRVGDEGQEHGRSDERVAPTSGPSAGWESRWPPVAGASPSRLGRQWQPSCTHRMSHRPHVNPRRSGRARRRTAPSPLLCLAVRGRPLLTGHHRGRRRRAVVVGPVATRPGRCSGGAVSSPMSWAGPAGLLEVPAA